MLLHIQQGPLQPFVLDEIDNLMPNDHVENPSVTKIEPLVPPSPVIESNNLDLNEFQHLETDTDSIFRNFHWLSVSRIHCYFKLPSLAAICKRKQCYQHDSHTTDQERIRRSRSRRHSPLVQPVPILYSVSPV